MSKKGIKLETVLEILKFDDKDLNIVIIDDESSIGAFEFFLGIVYIIIGILLFLYIINSFY